MLEDSFPVHPIDRDTLSARYDQIIHHLTAVRAQRNPGLSSAS